MTEFRVFLWELCKVLALLNVDLLLASMALSVVLGAIGKALGIGGKDEID